MQPTLCSLSEEVVWLCPIQCTKTLELYMYALCRSDSVSDWSGRLSGGIITSQI